MLWPTARSAFRTAVAGLAAVSGAAVMPSIGTTFNDAFVGAGVLAAVWWGVDSHRRRPLWAVWLPMGLLAGLVTGLKLTGAFYCLGLAAAALVAGSLRTAPARMLALATGGVLGADNRRSVGLLSLAGARQPYLSLFQPMVPVAGRVAPFAQG
jgi:hypothetical protein